MLVKDVMATGNVLTAREEDDLALTTQMMAWANVRHLPVLAGDEVTGLLTERELLLHRQDQASVKVAEVMNRNVALAFPDEPLSEAIARMVETQNECLPVVEDHRLVGLLTPLDVLAHETGAPQTALPGGRARSFPPVEEVMKHDPATVHGQHLLLDAAALMAALNVRHVPVVGDRGQLLGMLSDRDIRNRIGDPWSALHEPEVRARVRDLRVWTAMTCPAVCVPASANMGDAVARLIEDRVGVVVVIDREERPIGILSYVDALRALSTTPPH